MNYFNAFKKVMLAIAVTKAAAVIIVSVATASAMASEGGQGVGNGGDGIWLNVEGSRKLFSLDLVEAGVERHPYFSNLKIRHAIYVRVEKALRNIDHAPVALIAEKIEEILAVLPELGYAQLLALEEYHWIQVNQRLIDVNEDRAQIVLSKKNKVQIAVRLNRIVRVSADGWKLLDQKNRAALIHHEINFALMKAFNKYDPQSRQQVFAQDGLTARTATGFMFSAEFASTNLHRREQLKALIGDRMNWVDLRDQDLTDQGFQISENTIFSQVLAATLGTGFRKKYPVMSQEFFIIRHKIIQHTYSEPSSAIGGGQQHTYYSTRDEKEPYPAPYQYPPTQMVEIKRRYYSPIWSSKEYAVGGSEKFCRAELKELFQRYPLSSNRQCPGTLIGLYWYDGNPRVTDGNHNDSVLPTTIPCPKNFDLEYTPYVSIDLIVHEPKLIFKTSTTPSGVSEEFPEFEVRHSERRIVHQRVLGGDSVQSCAVEMNRIWQNMQETTVPYTH